MPELQKLGFNLTIKQGRTSILQNARFKYLIALIFLGICFSAQGQVLMINGVEFDGKAKVLIDSSSVFRLKEVDADAGVDIAFARGVTGIAMKSLNSAADFNEFAVWPWLQESYRRRINSNPNATQAFTPSMMSGTRVVIMAVKDEKVLKSWTVFLR